MHLDLWFRPKNAAEFSVPGGMMWVGMFLVYCCPPGLSPSGPAGIAGFLGAPADPSGAGVEEAEECPLRGLTGSFLWFTSPFSFAATAARGGVRGRMPFWCTGDDDELLLLPVCRDGKGTFRKPF